MNRSIVAAAILAACQPAAQEPAEVALATEAEKTAYALGFGLGRNLVSLELGELEVEALAQGIADSVAEAEPRVDMAVYEPKVRQLAAARAASAAQERRAAEGAFLEQEAAKEGAQQFDSGLILTHLKQGEGDAPGAEDRLIVHYHGTFPDGTVFDSSLRRGHPATFGLSGIIPCWTEALQQMKVGGRARAVCPPDTAYGDRGAPPRIPPGATLVFEIELLGIAE